MTYFAKIGTKKIQLDNITDPQDAQKVLAFQYPEVENAEVRTKTEGEHTIFEFIPRPGRKG